MMKMGNGNGKFGDERYVVALAKGELGKDIQRYLEEEFGIEIETENRPVNFKQTMGNVTFWPVKSDDVPKCIGGFEGKDVDGGDIYVPPEAHFGITGLDFATSYGMERAGRLNILRELDFGTGDLLLFSKYPIESIKSHGRTPIVVTEHRYKTLLQKGTAGEFLGDTFGEFYVMGVGGGVEGYIVQEVGDIGFDFSTYLRKKNGAAKNTTIARNGLHVMAHAMATNAVVVARNSPTYTFDLFDEEMRNASEYEMEGVASARVTPRRRIHYLTEVRV